MNPTSSFIQIYSWFLKLLKVGKMDRQRVTNRQLIRALLKCTGANVSKNCQNADVKDL